MPASSMQHLLEFHSPTAALAVTPLKGSARGTTWVVVTLVAACAAAASLIPVDKVVTAQGRIVAQAPTSVVQPLMIAVAAAAPFTEGELVAWLDDGPRRVGNCQIVVEGRTRLDGVAACDEQP